jgi:hypothetical protein
LGELTLESDRARGYVRVDWFTADGLPTWGDGRLMLLGTEGTIELRKYVDLDGRPGTDHLFLVNGQGTRHIDASREPLTYFRAFVADVRDRTETAMTQRHVFTVSRLALEAQRDARRPLSAAGLRIRLHAKDRCQHHRAWPRLPAACAQPARPRRAGGGHLGRHPQPARADAFAAQFPFPTTTDLDAGHQRPARRAPCWC